MQSDRWFRRRILYKVQTEVHISPTLVIDGQWYDNQRLLFIPSKLLLSRRIQS